MLIYFVFHTSLISLELFLMFPFQNWGNLFTWDCFKSFCGWWEFILELCALTTCRNQAEAAQVCQVWGGCDLWNTFHLSPSSPSSALSLSLPPAPCAPGSCAGIWALLWELSGEWKKLSSCWDWQSTNERQLRALDGAVGFSLCPSKPP